MRCKAAVVSRIGPLSGKFKPVKSLKTFQWAAEPTHPVPGRPPPNPSPTTWLRPIWTRFGPNLALVILNPKSKSKSGPTLTCFHASLFPFCPLCWPPLFLPFSRHIFAIISPSKSALFCSLVALNRRFWIENRAILNRAIRIVRFHILRVASLWRWLAGDGLPELTSSLLQQQKLVC